MAQTWVLRYRYETQFTRNEKYTNTAGTKCKKPKPSKIRRYPIESSEGIKKKVNVKNTGLFRLFVPMYSPHYSFMAFHKYFLGLLSNNHKSSSSKEDCWELLHTSAHSIHPHKDTQLVCISAADSPNAFATAHLAQVHSPLIP